MVYYNKVNTLSWHSFNFHKLSNGLAGFSPKLKTLHHFEGNDLIAQARYLVMHKYRLFKFQLEVTVVIRPEIKFPARIEMAFLQIANR